MSQPITPTPNASAPPEAFSVIDEIILVKLDAFAHLLTLLELTPAQIRTLGAADHFDAMAATLRNAQKVAEGIENFFFVPSFSIDSALDRGRAMKGQ